MIFLVLFLLLYHDHRILHFFPTRRSSDLSSTEVIDAEATGPAHDRPGQPLRLSRWRGAGPGDAPGKSKDRKSTRLNSSHVKISYAVFCLKKKNRPEEQNREILTHSNQRKQ